MTTKEKATMIQDKPAAHSIADPRKGSQSVPGLGSRGFTLVEILFVIATIGILAALAIPVFQNFKDSAREMRAAEEIRGLDQAIVAYSIDSGGTYPVDDTQLETIVGQVRMIDPWGRRYKYTLGGGRLGHLGNLEKLNVYYDLYSVGADNGTNLNDIDDPLCDDDIVRAGDGTFIGLGKNY